MLKIPCCSSSKIQICAVFIDAVIIDLPFQFVIIFHQKFSMISFVQLYDRQVKEVASLQLQLDNSKELIYRQQTSLDEQQ